MSDLQSVISEVRHMKRSIAPYVQLLVLLTALDVHAAGPKLCSTEKVNHEDCIVVIDRLYPITLPTIQMKEGMQVIVQVQDPLSFETLTLDEVSATAVTALDQGAALVTAAIPNLKGFFWSSVTLPAAAAPLYEARIESEAEKRQLDVVNHELAVLTDMLNAVQASVPSNTSSDHLFDHITAVYAQINQVLAPIPKPGSKAKEEYIPPPSAPNTPDPWTEYPEWRDWMLCEFVGGSNCKPAIPFMNVLGDIGTLQGRLPAAPPAPAPDNPLFDQKTFDTLVKQTKADIEKLTDNEDKKKATAELKSLQSQENNLTSVIAALANTLTNVQKDFLTYYQNIYLAKDTLPTPKLDKNGNPLPMPIGAIYDPKATQPKNSPVAYKRLLGRQVVFSVNAVNQISIPLASVTATTAKISIATITVLYADPIFEMSAGALISFVHNRSFANQTVTTVPPGSSLTPGDIIISETKTHPEVVPFVAANWRVLPDFVIPIDHRRGAVYATAWLGLNPYTTLPEYGAGPTISWRSFMISALYNRAHQVVLNPGSYVGQVVCSPTASVGATPPPCTPAPPAPITHTSAINAFAIGISIRVPTTFTAGGVSH
ncbi:MAG: hypothetical protein WBD45_13810 [Terriglobales bacterium]